jgi:hypothetical protein
LIIGEDLIDAECNVGKLNEVNQLGSHMGHLFHTRRELSTALPRPLIIPQLPRMIAQARANPIRIASTFPISGKLKIRNRK